MLISNAYADTASSSGLSLGNLSSLWPIALMFVVVYFLMIRPQKKKQKEQQDMISALGIGDEILTSGGIVGRVIHVDTSFLVIEISAQSTMIIQKNAIVSLLPKGSMDAMLNSESTSHQEAKADSDLTQTKDTSSVTEEIDKEQEPIKDNTDKPGQPV